MSEPRPAPLASLRSSQERSLEKEGIPMILSLVCEGGVPPEVSDPVVIGGGRSIEAMVGAYWEALAPSQRDDDMGCVVAVLHAVAYDNFNVGVLE